MYVNKYTYLCMIVLSCCLIYANSEIVYVSKKALITGVTGQDGAYLAEFLLSKGYEVHGIKRRSSLFNTQRIDELRILHPTNFKLHFGDLTDGTNLVRLIQEIQPDEVYNLAAQSHVKVSFELPEYTSIVDALGTLKLLEAIRTCCLEKRIKFYQASSSEMYGKVREIPQSENTPFYPRLPYAAAKVYAYWITVNYRESYGIFACNGILFNHESPLRGETFVTRKITRAVARIAYGSEEILYLGNLDVRRDWGYAKEYVEAMWMILQYPEAQDWVIATGTTHSVREFVEHAFKCTGITIDWRGTGIEEKGYDKSTGRLLVAINENYFRPTEVDLLIGDATKAQTQLGWHAKTSFEELVTLMVQADMQEAKKTVSFNLSHR